MSWHSYEIIVSTSYKRKRQMMSVMPTVALRRRQKFWFLTKEIAVLTTFQHQKVEITKNNPEMQIFMGGCDFGLRGGGV